MPGEMSDDFVHGLKVINCVLDSPGRNTGSGTPERPAVERVSALEIRICTHIRVTPLLPLSWIAGHDLPEGRWPVPLQKDRDQRTFSLFTKIISPIVVAVDTDSRAIGTSFSSRDAMLGKVSVKRDAQGFH